MTKTKFDYSSTMDDTLTINGTGSYTFTAPDSLIGTWTVGAVPLTNISGTSIDWGNISTNTTINNTKSLQVEGDAEITGDLKVNGKSILSSLEKIEERLAILHPNPELEERWETLRDLRNKYQQLEKEIIEQEKMWSLLKQ